MKCMYSTRKSSNETAPFVNRKVMAVMGLERIYGSSSKSNVHSKNRAYPKVQFGRKG